MTAEARDLMLWVARWGGAVRRPATIARYDDVVQRFVAASIRPPRPPRQRAPYPYVDLGDLPIDEPASAGTRRFPGR